MNKNKCYTYFAIKGNFNTQDISNRLNLSPTKQWNIGDYRQNGTQYDFALWEYGRCNNFDFLVEKQMRETIKDLLPLKEELIKIKNEFDAHLVLEVVPEIYVGESSPCLAPSQDIIEFLYETGTEMDIDLYVYDNE